MRPFVTYVHALWDETRSIEIKFFMYVPVPYLVESEKDQLFPKQISLIQPQINKSLNFVRRTHFFLQNHHLRFVLLLGLK